MIERAVSYWRGLSPQTRRLTVGLAAGAAMATASAFVAGALDTYLHVRAPSMIFLCSVIFAALWFGRHVALATALIAFFIYNFYLVEPRGDFGFAGFEDVLTLLVFVGVALLIGGLAGSTHDQRERAKEQARIFSGLFTVSREMAERRERGAALELLAAGVCRIAARQSAVFQCSENGEVSLVCRAPAGSEPPLQTYATAAALFEGGAGEIAHAGEWRLQLIHAAGEQVGVLAWRPVTPASSAEHAMAVRLLSELTGVAIERTQLMKRQMELDTLAATDRLRTALMSSISHDFRTPLSTILTSASSLQAYGPQFSEDTRADLLANIQEEAERLNRFVSNILNMTRLDAGVVKPRDELIDPIEVLDSVQERIQKRMSGRTISVTAPAAAPAIFVDPVLLEQAIINAVENALVHTPDSCAIRIGAGYSGQSVRLWVEDDGPGVPEAQLTHIFDKFHRVETSRNTPGAGLGLAISKGFVEAMKGHVTAMSPASGGRGLRIEFTFPMQTALANT